MAPPPRPPESIQCSHTIWVSLCLGSGRGGDINGFFRHFCRARYNGGGAQRWAMIDREAASQRIFAPASPVNLSVLTCCFGPKAHGCRADGITISGIPGYGLMSGFEYEADRGPCKTEAGAHLVLQIAFVGKMRQFRIIDVNNERRRIAAHLGRVLHL